MHSRRIGVYTTVFPNALPFLDAFAASLRAQTERHFDVWVGLDRLVVEDVEPQLLIDRDITWVPPEPGDTFSTVRERAWRRMIAEYDAVVLVDSDDVLLPDRVSGACQQLDHCDVYACALALIGEDGAPLDLILNLGERVADWSAFLAAMNIFGLSNTAYRSGSLAAALPLPRRLGIIDWHLVSRAFDQGARLRFDDTVHMRYRQYEATTARIVPPFTADDIRSSTKHVLQHYENTASFIKSDAVFRERIEERHEEVRHFSRLSEARLTKYLRALDRLPWRAYRWWEVVANKELGELWFP